MTQAGEVTLPVKRPEFLDCAGLKNLRVWSIQDSHHLRKRFGEFARRVFGRVLPLGYEVIDPHRIVLVGINKRQMDCNGIRWSTSLAVVITDDQEISEPIHTFVLESGVKIGERLKQFVISIALALKTISKQNSAPAREVLLIELSAISVDKNVALVFGLLAQSFGQYLCFSEPRMDQNGRMGCVISITPQRPSGSRIVLQKYPS